MSDERLPLSAMVADLWCIYAAATAQKELLVRMDVNHEEVYYMM